MWFQRVDCVILDDGGFIVMSNQDDHISKVILCILKILSIKHSSGKHSIESHQQFLHVWVKLEFEYGNDCSLQVTSQDVPHSGTTGTENILSSISGLGHEMPNKIGFNQISLIVVGACYFCNM